MFDIFAKLLSSITSFLFPLFASYKALKTSDPAQLTPWLMYWVVLACALLVESWIEWFLVWIPFYAYIRLLFLLYLVLPQTQGARLFYEEYLHPCLEENETAIEELITSAHDRLRRAGIAYLSRAIELLKTNVLGMPPSAEPAAAAAPEPQTPQSYTQSLLARFTLPSTRWNTRQGAAASGQAQATGGGGLTTDFFNLLSSAVSAAASATSSSSSSKSPAGASSTSTSTSSIIPESIRAAGAAASVSFIQAQRERLRIVLSALDREEAAAHQQAQQQQQQQQQAQGPEQLSAAAVGGGGAGGNGDKRKSVSELSVGSGLSKSRSEPDFEKLDAPSGGEEDEGSAPAGVRRRAGGAPETPAGGRSGGGWMSWGWGTGGGEGGGRSSGVEK
ncbi:hypothetical protein MYCTH_2307115 [Thermothelomyces thermophilus ATCC 42464]|uniref:Protein YOP1 n=1 Tax=Thermothelomyces thermophilus (strain ATCC 42464 / BCRC 31852 / DSM 1799) TaxID=573729 RepID=G2QF93_THET4|nr:uncharacterized protein MYCTH_2307115 [Thermothelomyces thermophilus ATCC 42464]AEO59122.1 hypothetical protein MYCTH_2307115 [Thermothelomyces thermophilus ATCC 42464]